MQPRSPTPVPSLRPDFAEQLEARLAEADRARARHARRSLLGRIGLLVLLIGPLLSWRLTAAGSGDRHLAVDALAWLTFLLNVGTRVNAQMLRYLHLQSLPTIAGVAVLVLVTAGLLWTSTGDEHE